MSLDTALLLYEKGEDFFPVRQQSAMEELRRYKASGTVQQVQILAARDACLSCMKLDGAVFSVDQALEQMPIPSSECTFELLEGRPGWCRCTYLPMVSVPPEGGSLSVERRSAILDQEIARYSRQGFRVIARTATTVQLLKPKKFSCLFACLWFLVFGIGVLIYIFYYMAKKDTIIYLEVDPLGNVKRHR